MIRLRCGVVLTDRFLRYLAEEAARRKAAVQGIEPVAIIDYVKCSDGLRSGQAWWNLTWGKCTGNLENWCLFDAEGVPVYLSRQTQRALRWKHIDYVGGKVQVPLEVPPP